MPSPPSAFEALLGRRTTLRIRRFGPPGAFLTEPEKFNEENAPCLLLLGSEIPEGAREGDSLSVFVYLDSQDRPLATTKMPALMLGEVGFLNVTACTSVGAFFEWGLPKELLVPFAEQTAKLSVGARHPVGLYIDNSGRLAGTMRVAEMLDVGRHEFARDEWVEGEAWRNDPEIGLFVILAKAFVGLMPRQEPHSMKRGEAGRFRVTRVHPDGKIELSKRGHAHTELDADAERILAVLRRDGAPRVGDHSSPEQIRELFGLSKKAFKRAMGRLFRQRLVRVDSSDYFVASPPSDEPPSAR